jgi:hypothetical protein
MIGQLQWKPCVRASAFHAVRCLLELRTLRDKPLELLMSSVARRIQQIDLPDSAWENIIPLSTRIDSDFALASAIMQSVQESHYSGRLMHDQLLQMLRECQQAMQDLHPNLREELRLRVRPLREQWEARGPGLMMAVGRKTDDCIASTQADAVLVHPVLGGGGTSFPRHRVVVIEAVLANPFAELPEVSRLGWLVSQIGACEAFGDAQLEQWNPATLSIALIPACLEAAEEVELVRTDARTVELAIRTWLPGLSEPAQRADLLLHWWRNQQAEPESWAEAVSTLDALSC